MVTWIHDNEIKLINLYMQDKYYDKENKRKE